MHCFILILVQSKIEHICLNNYEMDATMSIKRKEKECEMREFFSPFLSRCIRLLYAKRENSSWYDFRYGNKRQRRISSIVLMNKYDNSNILLLEQLHSFVSYVCTILI